MTVQAFRIQNFMGFEDSGWIELRAVTLLFGRNSSGKSALIRALRLLKQSLYASPSNGPLVFVGEEGLDQGSFLETVHNQRVDEPMVFHFRCQLGKGLDGLIEIVNRYRQQQGEVLLSLKEIEESDWVDFSLGFKWDEKKHQSRLAFVRMDCSQVWGVTEPVFVGEIDVSARFQISNDFLLGPLNGNSMWATASLKSVAGFLPTLTGSQLPDQENWQVLKEFFLVQSWIDDLQESIRHFLESINYLGPIRPEPQRVYTLDVLSRQRLLQRGLSFWLAFLLDQVRSEQLIEIDEWLQRLGLGRKIKRQKEKYSSEAVTISEVMVHEGKANSAINLTDMGYGASQVLPVIALSVLAKEGSLVIIEQPELHLHPSAQAKLADLFIQVAIRKNVRLIIETHSEHLYLRLRRRMAESKVGIISTQADQYLPEGALGVYFVDRQEGISFVEEIEIGPIGEIVSSPKGFKGFFTDDLREVAMLTKAQLDFE